MPPIPPTLPLLPLLPLELLLLDELLEALVLAAPPIPALPLELDSPELLDALEDPPLSHDAAAKTIERIGQHGKSKRFMKDLRGDVTTTSIVCRVCGVLESRLNRCWNV